jgi:hypothetical protein
MKNERVSLLHYGEIFLEAGLDDLLLKNGALLACHETDDLFAERALKSVFIYVVGYPAFVVLSVKVGS